MSSLNHDVVIVGAGIAGISAAYQLAKQHPYLNMLVLESRESLGGTWDLYRYPGVRCDSDMFTYGFSFNPWPHKCAFASGEQIRQYLNETVEKFDLLKLMRFGMSIEDADWSSEHACWTLKVNKKGLKKPLSLTCRYLLMCTGYFSYKAGHVPEISGLSGFQGQIIDPQHWPKQINLSEQNIALIGSGATAISLAPALLKIAKSVTMIQRTPCYIYAKPNIGLVSDVLHGFLPKRLFVKLQRYHNLFIQAWFVNFCRLFPAWAKHWFVGYMQTQFANSTASNFELTPSYFPWQQRVCITPDGEFFEAVKSGGLVIETSTIANIQDKGVELDSGSFIPADTIVMATGFDIQVYGGVKITVDGQLKTLSDCVIYKGAMLSDIPNFIYFGGNSKSSWTMRVELIAKFVCRLVRYMARCDYSKCTPRLTEKNLSMPLTRLDNNFMPGYLLRNAHLFPQSGDKYPWKTPDNYLQDKQDLLKRPINQRDLQLD